MTELASRFALLLLFPARWLAYLDEPPRSDREAALYITEATERRGSPARARLPRHAAPSVAIANPALNARHQITTVL